MLIHVHLLWNHIYMILASVMLVIVKTVVISAVVKGFRYNNKTSLVVGSVISTNRRIFFCTALLVLQIFNLLGGNLYLLLLGTAGLSLVTTPLLFKLIPAVVHLGVLLRWFSPDTQNEFQLRFKGDSLPSGSALISRDLSSHEGDEFQGKSPV